MIFDQYFGHDDDEHDDHNDEHHGDCDGDHCDHVDDDVDDDGGDSASDSDGCDDHGYHKVNFNFLASAWTSLACTKY